MVNKVLICGGDAVTAAFVRSCIQSDLRYNCTWFLPEDGSINAATVDALLSDTLFANRFVLDKSAAPTYADYEVLLIAPPTDDADDATNIAWLQQILNAAMAAGFKGKVCLAFNNDYLPVYLAQHFSGLRPENIIGIGTLPESLIVKQLLSKRFRIEPRSITVNVYGITSNPFICWSQAQISGVPLQSFVDDDNAVFNADQLTAISQQSQSLAQSAHVIAEIRGLQLMLNALVLGRAIIAPVTHIEEITPTPSAISTPVLLGNNGITAFTIPAMTTAEEQQLAQIKAVVTQAIVAYTQR